MSYSDSDQDSFVVHGSPPPPPSPAEPSEPEVENIPSPREAKKAQPSGRGRGRGRGRGTVTGTGQRATTRRKKPPIVESEDNDNDDAAADGDYDAAADATGGEPAEEEEEEDTLNCSLVGIELYNFKSYRGHHIVGPFTDLTAIVGSNGSGKSNLLDAISFALCVRSSKHRARNLSDLVSQKKPLNGDNTAEEDEEEDQWDAEESLLAFVKLVLRSRPSTTTTTTEAGTSAVKEFTFQRGILANRTSQYKADERVCALPDYKRQLHRLRLDANSKIFLLFQGTIDAFVTKSADKLTKVIEELSGSGEYAAAYNRLNKAIKEKSDQLMICRQERTSLLRSNEFIRSMIERRQAGDNITGQIETLRSRLALLDLQENAAELERARERLRLAEAEVADAEAAIRGGLERAKAEAKRALEAAARAASAAEGEHRTAALALEAQEQSALRTLEAQLGAARKRHALAQRNAHELERKRVVMLQEAEQYREELADIDGSIAAANEQLQREQQASGEEGGGGGELLLTPEQQNQFIRLKQTLQQRLATTGDGYSRAADLERDIARLGREVTTGERDLAFLASERAGLEAANEQVERALSSLAADVATLTASQEKALAEEAVARGARDAAAQALQQQERGLKEARETFRAKFSSFLLNRKRVEEKAKIDRLVAAYRGRVHGRLGALCKPANRSHLAVYNIVARRHLNTVLVDSMATMREVMEQEARSDYASLKFLPLDVLLPRGSRSTSPLSESLAPMREAVKKIRGRGGGDGHDHGGQADSHSCRLLYDLIRLPPGVANADRALFMAVGNAVVAPDRETASAVVNQLRQCRAISARCGTLYNNPVEIVADFGGRGGVGGGFGAHGLVDAFDDESFQAEEERVARKERQLTEAQQALTEATTALEPLAAKVVRLTAQLNIKRAHLEDLKTRLARQQTELVALEQEKIPAKEEELAAARAQLEEKEAALAEVRRAAVDEVFGAFFAQFEGRGGFEGEADLAKFEAALYGDGKRVREAMEALEGLHRRREALLAKMVFPTAAEGEEGAAEEGRASGTPATGTAIDSTLKLWEDKAEKERLKVARLEADMAAAREALAAKQATLEALRERAQQAAEGRRLAKAAAKQAATELEAAYRRQTDAQHALVAARKAVRSRAKARYELFRSAYVEAVQLPVDSQLLAELFAEQEEEEDEDVGPEDFEGAADLQVDYGPIAELLAEIATAAEEEGGPPAPAPPPPPTAAAKRKKTKKNNQEVEKKARTRPEVKYALQTELKALEDELKKVTVSEEVDLSEEESELRRKMRSNAAQLRKLENEVLTLRRQFADVRGHRQRRFSAYLGAVFARIDAVYKALVGRADAQAILLPLDGEEGYLAGLHYSCIAPGKQFQEMRLMSGGERCLAAFAFIYAVYPPARLPSFFVMDELDGSLDGANIERLLGFVKDRGGLAGGTQFIFISHNAHLIGQMDSLIGVTREDVHGDVSLSDIDRPENVIPPPATTISPVYFTSRTFALDLREYDDDDETVTQQQQQQQQPPTTMEGEAGGEAMDE